MTKRQNLFLFIRRTSFSCQSSCTQLCSLPGSLLNNTQNHLFEFSQMGALFLHLSFCPLFTHQVLEGGMGVMNAASEQDERRMLYTSKEQCLIELKKKKICINSLFFLESLTSLTRICSGTGKGTEKMTVTLSAFGMCRIIQFRVQWLWQSTAFLVNVMYLEKVDRADVSLAQQGF